MRYSQSEVERRTKFLGLRVGISKPGDGATRYEFVGFIDPVTGGWGRTIGYAVGASQAMQFLRGFEEGLRAAEERAAKKSESAERV